MALAIIHRCFKWWYFPGLAVKW